MSPSTNHIVTFDASRISASVASAHPRGALDDWRRAPAGCPSASGDDAAESRSLLSAAPAPRVSSRLRSCNSLNSRTFSMAITAWSAKVSSSAICLSVNGRTSFDGS